MQRHVFSKVTVLLLLSLCLICLAACGSKPEGTLGNNEAETGAVPQDTSDVGSDSAASSGSNETEPVTSAPEVETEPSPSQSEDIGKESGPSAPEPEDDGAVIEKITGASDDVGIYAVVLTLSDKAADKGVVEMVYHGAKGTPQENSVVNTFRIEYYKEDAGTFEVHTFFDGEVYQNLHHQSKVKVNNTFSSAIRAGDVVITYTPDGGESREIFRADSEQFRAS